MTPQESQILRFEACGSRGAARRGDALSKATTSSNSSWLVEQLVPLEEAMTLAEKAFGGKRAGPKGKGKGKGKAKSKGRG